MYRENEDVCLSIYNSSKGKKSLVLSIAPQFTDKLPVRAVLQLEGNKLYICESEIGVKLLLDKKGMLQGIYNFGVQKQISYLQDNISNIEGKYILKYDLEKQAHYIEFTKEQIQISLVKIKEKEAESEVKSIELLIIEELISTLKTELSKKRIKSAKAILQALGIYIDKL